MKRFARFFLIFSIVSLFFQLYLSNDFFAPVKGAILKSPTKDSYVWELYPNNNYGTYTFLYVSSYSGRDKRFYIEFDISGYSSVSEAVLKVYCEDGIASRVYVVTRILDNTWTESGITWNNQPSVNSTNEVTLNAPSSSGLWWNVTVTSMVNDALKESKTVVGFKVKDQTEDSSTTKQSYYRGKEYSNTTYDPYLELTLPAPTYSGFTVEGWECGLPIYANATWQAGIGSLSHYRIETNNTGTYLNTTYAFSGSYSNASFTLTSTPYKNVRVRIHANNTYNQWNNTSWHDIIAFPKTPEMQHEELGYSTTSGRNTIYIKDATIPAIYYVWLNSTTTKFECAAYNVVNRRRTATYFIANAPSPEGHWEPSIGKFPNGSIGVFWGHSQPVKYRYTTGSANTATSLDTLLSSWSSEQTVPLGSDDHCSVPLVASFDDTLILWVRGGVGAMEFDRWLIINHTTIWGTPRVVVNTAASGGNHHVNPSNMLKYNETMIIWTGWTYNATQGYRKTLFFYSNDKGWTFKKYNGDSLTVPFGDNDITIHNVVGYFCTSYQRAYLDNNKHIFVPYSPTSVIDTSTYKSLLAYYNAPIGTAGGSWTFGTYVSDENGNVIRSSQRFSIYYDSYYQKPTIWNSPLDISDPDVNDEFWGGYPTKWVQDPWNYSRFHKVFEWTNYTMAISGLQIEGMPRSHEYYGKSVRDNIIGYQTKGSNTLQLTYVNYAWASKFQPSATTCIDCLWLRLRWTGSSSNALHGKVALYEDTGSTKTLVSGGSDVDIVGGATSQGFNGWSCIPLDDYVLLNTSKTYWLVFQINLALGGDSYIYNSTGTTSQTFRVTRTYANSWENQLTPSTYFNYKISIFGIQDVLVASGLGVTPLPILANKWTNTTATVYDIGYTLEQICATLQYEGINAWKIQKDNGTIYQYNYGYTANSHVKILSTDDIIRIYSYSSGFWSYGYFHFKYLSITNLATIEAWNILLKSQMRLLSSLTQNLDWGLSPKSDYLLTLAMSHFPNWLLTIRVPLRFPVGGIVIPTDALTFFAPYIGVASTILVTTVAAVVYVKRVKRRKGGNDRHSD